MMRQSVTGEVNLVDLWRELEHIEYELQTVRDGSRDITVTEDDLKLLVRRVLIRMSGIVRFVFDETLHHLEFDRPGRVIDGSGIVSDPRKCQQTVLDEVFEPAKFAEPQTFQPL